jgi:hypothetical protein
MKRKNIILTLGLISLIIIVIVSYGLCQTDEITNKIVTLLLSGLGTIATISALVIVFLPKPKFKGEVYCYNSNKPTFVAKEKDTHVQYNLISFNIVNKSQSALSNLHITFKLPSNVINNIGYSEQDMAVKQIKESMYITLKNPVILGSSEGDNEYKVEHYIATQRWNKGNIYISISADQIEVTTVVVKKDLASSISSFTSSNQLKIY